MKIIFEEHISTRKPPVNMEQEDLLLFKHEFEKQIRNTHLIHIKNGIVLHDIIISFAQGLKGLLSYTLVHPVLRKKELLKRIFMFKRGVRTIPKGLWIIDDGSLGYFHFLTDVLPRFVAYSRSEKPCPILLPETYKKHPYTHESLKLIGVEIIYFNSSVPLRVKDLFIVSHTADTGNYHPVLVNDLRKIFLAGFTKEGNRKIYISRSQASKRKITNEHEVENLVRSFGYEVHYFENYSLQSQVELMSQSRYLIGLHGAGLTNMLFMKEKCRVMELRNSNDAHNNCYFSLASELNIDYYYQLCKGDRNDTHNVNITVDIDAMRRNIEKMEQA